MAENKTLRQIARSFVADGPSGVSIRDRLKGLTSQDDKVLRLVGAHMGRLASRDLARRCRDGLEHSTGTWAERKRDLTAGSSSRWAGSVTSSTHDQCGLSRRAQWRHLRSLDAGILPVVPLEALQAGGVIGADTSRWGARHWQKPLTTSRRPFSMITSDHCSGTVER